MNDATDEGRNLPFTVRPVSFALGAEIDGVDPADDLEEAVIDAIREVWHRHHLLLLRGRPLGPEALVSFAGRFGALDCHDATPFYRLEEHPEILQITNREIGGNTKLR